MQAEVNSTRLRFGSISPAILGMVCGMAMVLSSSIGNMMYANVMPNAPLSTLGCDGNSTFLNASLIATSVKEHNAEMISNIPQLYLMSYFWYAAVCVSVGLLVAILLTFVFGAQSPDDIDHKLIFPFVIKICHRMPKRIQKMLLFKNVTADRNESATSEMIPASAHTAKNSDVNN